MEYLKDEKLLLNKKGIGSGIYNYDEQYLSEEGQQLMEKYSGYTPLYTCGYYTLEQMKNLPDGEVYLKEVMVNIEKIEKEAEKSFAKNRAQSIDSFGPLLYNVQVLSWAKFHLGTRKGAKKNMATIKVGENETLDSALRRFKRRCARDGIIGDLRKKEQYEKPSVRRKKKAEAARKRSRM